MKESFGLSVRRACGLVDLRRSTWHYRSENHASDEALRKRMRELAQKKRRWGSPQLHRVLKREGYVVNHKRTERIYRGENLSLKVRKRKKRGSELRVELPKPQRVNERWSMDFVSDSLSTGRRFRILTIVDNYTRECPAMEVDVSIGGARVVRVLEQLKETRGLPKIITVDNGPEFPGQALDEWAYRNNVRLNFIRPGRPVEIAYIESFKGKFRDDCLNENWFMSLQEARELIEGEWSTTSSGRTVLCRT